MFSSLFSKIPVALLFGFCSNALFAQPGLGPRSARQDSEKVEALRVAFMTEALKLTTSEAEVFWPMMREHQLEMKSAQTEMDSLRSNMQESSQLTDAECWALLEHIQELQVEEITARGSWVKEVAEILGPQRAVQLPFLEERFRRRIFQELQNRSNHKGPTNRRGPR
jgi:hypothetical protein